VNILAQLRRDLTEIGDANFELITFELVRIDFPDAKKLANPDGGADIIVPAPSGGKPRVFQAKHYPDQISWSKCLASLNEAVRTHDPERVTFCFPRDLTDPQRQKFKEKLVAAHPQITVDYWGVSDFHVKLAAAPEIAARFFPRVRNDALRAATRAIGQGGKPLESGIDIILRAGDLARFADEIDPRFRQQITQGTAQDFQEPSGWAEIPFLTMKVRDDQTVVRLDFWPRPGTEVALPTWGFVDNEAGRGSLEEARTMLALGREANVTESIQVALRDAPALMNELAGECQSVEITGQLTIQPGEPVPLIFEIETSDDTVVRTVNLRPVLPRQAGCADFVAIDSALRIELEFELLERPTIRLSSTFTLMPGSSAKENLAAATVLDAFGRNSKITLRAPGLLPEEGLVETGARLSEDAAKAASFLRHLSAGIVAIEEQVGFEFDVPESIRREDVENVLNAASWLRGEEGSASVGEMTLTFNPSEVARNVEGLANGEGEARLPIELEIFGRLVPIGMIEMKIPPMKVLEMQPTGSHPNAPVRVKIVPASDDVSRPFKLLRNGRLTRVVVPRLAVEVPQRTPLVEVAKPGDVFGMVRRSRTP